jgi:hypothetical protein
MLQIDLWQLEGFVWCAGGIWHQSVWIRGQGGNGEYRYYWNDELLAGPLTEEGYTFEVQGTDAAVIGTGTVVSGDGQEATKELFVSKPRCP